MGAAGCVLLALLWPLQTWADDGRAGWVDAARIAAADAEPGSWLTHGRSYDEQRFSPLAAIHRGNVTELGLAWSHVTGTRRGLEATPIVVDGVLYATATWSVVFALDAVSGRELWRFDPQVPRWKGRYACCDAVNRGVAVWRGRVYAGTLDGRLVALDARTGQLVWEVTTVDPERPYTITGAPRIVKGRVVIGNGGADLGVRGYFSAYDAETGALVWRFYTVPASSDGPFEQPELAMAAKTWSRDSLFESGLGGTVWDSFAYDPELDLLYAGVGNASMYDRQRRSPGGGDNLFLASILAVKPDTGRLVWYYQTTPGEQWDYTATAHMILADLELDGRVRKVLMQAPKNGFFYVLDRETGELLSANNYVDVSWASHVDLSTGRPVERPEASWSEAKAYVTPAPPGGHNWHPMAFSPRTRLVYLPVFSATHAFYPDARYRWILGAWNTGEDLGAVQHDLEDTGRAIPFCSPTRLVAWDPVARRERWRVSHRDGVPAGVLATAGDLVFQGHGGFFAAYDARSGKKLWESEVGVGIMAPPITYSVAGEQYVVVLAGLGGSQGGHYTRFEYENDGRVLAYKLGGGAPMPPARRIEPGRVDVEGLPVPPPESVDRGRDLYGRHCLFCHGMGVASSGLYPDLRYSTRAVHEQWQEIVLGGTRQSVGMASFADRIGPEESRDIQAYVIARARHEPGLVERVLDWAGQYVCIPAIWMAD